MSKSSIRKALYLSGPMTGHEDFNYPAFHEAAAHLRMVGYAVINPAEAYEGDQALPFDVYMRHDIRSLLQDCDTIVVLPGWETSPGAVLEVAIAAALGHGILSYDEGSLASTFPVHETNRQRLAEVLGSFEYPDDLTVPDDEVIELLEQAVKPSSPEPMSDWLEADNGLLKAADGIVNGDRQRTYGHPITHHTATAAMWSAYLTRVNGEKKVEVRPQDVSVCMILDKVSRVGGGDKVDNLLDIAGYAQVHAKVRARQERGA